MLEWVSMFPTQTQGPEWDPSGSSTAHIVWLGRGALITALPGHSSQQRRKSPGLVEDPMPQENGAKHDRVGLRMSASEHGCTRHAQPYTHRRRQGRGKGEEKGWTTKAAPTAGRLPVSSQGWDSTEDPQSSSQRKSRKSQWRKEVDTPAKELLAAGSF